MDCEEAFPGQIDCSPPVQVHDIERIITHENYSTTNLWHDIALIRLKQPIEFSEYVSPICLPTSDTLSTLNKKAATVAGWGLTEAGKQSKTKYFFFIRTYKHIFAALPSTKLVKAHLVIVSNNDCQSEYSKISNIKILDQQLCAKGLKYAFTCGGDSGGPLKTVHIVNSEEVFVQYGIISFRTVYCVNDKPVVLTRVSEYMNWILDNIAP